LPDQPAKEQASAAILTLTRRSVSVPVIGIPQYVQYLKRIVDHAPTFEPTEALRGDLSFHASGIPDCDPISGLVPGAERATAVPISSRL
jgi:hypothetical protein